MLSKVMADYLKNVDSEEMHVLNFCNSLDAGVVISTALAEYEGEALPLMFAIAKHGEIDVFKACLERFEDELIASQCEDLIDFAMKNPHWKSICDQIVAVQWKHRLSIGLLDSAEQIAYIWEHRAVFNHSSVLGVCGGLIKDGIKLKQELEEVRKKYEDKINNRERLADADFRHNVDILQLESQLEDSNKKIIALEKDLNELRENVGKLLV